MRPYQCLKALSLVAYLLILFQGMLIAMPLASCLIFWSFKADSLSLQLCSIGAILGLIAIILNRKKFNNKLYVDVLGFTLLMLPLINRISAFPKELGGSKGFYIPAISFIVLFVIYLILKYRKISN